MDSGFDGHRLYDYVTERFACLLEPNGEVDKYNAWGHSFLCEAALNAYRRDSDERWLRFLEMATTKAFERRDDASGRMDSARGRVLKSWGMPAPPDHTWTNSVTAPGRILTPTLDYMVMSGQQEQLLARCIEVVEEFVPEFVRHEDEGLFRRPAKGDWEPLNHALSMGRALLRLYAITGDHRYRDMVERLATLFRHSLVLEGGDRYAWPYRPNLKNKTRGFPTTYWKADVDLCFAVECLKAAIVFDETDMARFANTLKMSILRPDFLNSHVSMVEPDRLRDRASKITTRVYGLCGWMVLAEFDGEVEALIDDAIERHIDIMPGGWFGVPRAVWGYSMRAG